MSLDPEARTAKLQGGEEVGFEQALIATGAMVNILRVEGAENEGVHYLRAFGNSDAIRADAESAEHVVLVGGSYIGAEVAASLTARGTKCTIVTLEDMALSRSFGEDAGRWFHELLESQGRDDPRRRGAGGLRGRRPGARGADQERPGDRVRRGGRRRRGTAGHDARREGGAGGRATGSSATRSFRPRRPGIYAAGDCCSYESVVHGRRLRVEHWDVAMQQGMHAAAQHAGRRRGLRGRPLLLQRPRRLGRASSTSVRRRSGTRRSGAATATPASSPSGT